MGAGLEAGAAWLSELGLAGWIGAAEDSREEKPWGAGGAGWASPHGAGGTGAGAAGVAAINAAAGRGAEKDTPGVGEADGFTGGKKGDGSGADIGATGGDAGEPPSGEGVMRTGAAEAKGNGAVIVVGGTG